MNKRKNGKLPALFDDYYFTFTSKVHNRMTRQASKNNFFMRRVTKSSTKQSIKVSGSNIWKTLSPELRLSFEKGRLISINKLKRYLFNIQSTITSYWPIKVYRLSLRRKFA